MRGRVYIHIRGPGGTFARTEINNLHTHIPARLKKFPPAFLNTRLILLTRSGITYLDPTRRIGGDDTSTYLDLGKLMNHKGS